MEMDLSSYKLSKLETSKLKVGDFELSFVPKDEKERCLEIKEFIECHE